MKYLKIYEQVKNRITFKEWQFKNLKTLYCANNQLTELPDLSQNKNLV